MVYEIGIVRGRHLSWFLSRWFWLHHPCAVCVRAWGLFLWGGYSDLRCLELSQFLIYSVNVVSSAMEPSAAESLSCDIKDTPTKHIPKKDTSMLPSPFEGRYVSLLRQWNIEHLNKTWACLGAPGESNFILYRFCRRLEERLSSSTPSGRKDWSNQEIVAWMTAPEQPCYFAEAICEVITQLDWSRKVLSRDKGVEGKLCRLPEAGLGSEAIVPLASVYKDDRACLVF